MQAGGAGMGAKHMSDPTRKTGGKCLISSFHNRAGSAHDKYSAKVRKLPRTKIIKCYKILIFSNVCIAAFVYNTYSLRSVFRCLSRWSGVSCMPSTTANRHYCYCKSTMKLQLLQRLLGRTLTFSLHFSILLICFSCFPRPFASNLKLS